MAKGGMLLNTIISIPGRNVKTEFNSFACLSLVMNINQKFNLKLIDIRYLITKNDMQKIKPPLIFANKKFLKFVTIKLAFLVPVCDILV